jgi:AmiR/NasT family two-component response regulator
LKILVAKDENISRMVLQASLMKQGHEVVGFENRGLRPETKTNS